MTPVWFLRSVHMSATRERTRRDGSSSYTPSTCRPEPDVTSPVALQWSASLLKGHPETPPEDSPRKEGLRSRGESGRVGEEDEGRGRGRTARSLTQTPPKTKVSVEKVVLSRDETRG